MLNPHIATSQVLTAGSIVRLITYTSMGALVGWFATHHRDLSDRLRIASERDHLTGLLNTRAFDAALTGAARARPPVRPDPGGHGQHEGDQRLRGPRRRQRRAPARAARYSRAAGSRTTQVARIGGDEFAVITSQAEQRDRPRALQPADRRARGGGISMSFGWAVCPRDGESALLLFRAADERLYAQKLIRSRLTAAEVVALPSQAERLAMRSRTPPDHPPRV